ncbi:MAG: type II secretion system F family protein [Phycisphaerae bacterium]|nr:type II secretion system F family protein [Phycisphaerae bacterium]
MPLLDADFMNEVQSHAVAAEQEVHRPAAKKKAGIEILHRAGTKELCRIARQLAALLHAGMPLVPAMSALVEQLECPAEAKGGSLIARRKPLAEAIRQVRDDVNEGISLAEALGKHPGVFSPLFVSMVSAGESSGALEEVLGRVADILEKRVQLVAKVKAAMTYPTVMALVATGVVIFLIAYVVPGITRLFTEMKQELPWPTRLLISISSFTRAYVAILLGLLCGGAVAVVAMYKNAEGKAWVDRVVLKLPVFGPLLLRLELARLTRTLGSLMKSGLPVISAMEITQRIIQNSVIADAMKAIRESVHTGDNIAGAMKATGMFPPVVYHLIATGQMSGNIEDGLIDIAQMYDTEVEASVRTLTSLLEPVILLVMGGIVTFIVLAILLPIFEINQSL